MPGTGTASYSGTPPAAGQAMAIPAPARVRRQLSKQQRAARQMRRDILTALGYTGSFNVNDIKRERPDIIKALKAHNAFSGGPSVRQAAANRGGTGSGTPENASFASLVADRNAAYRQKRTSRARRA